VSTRTSVLQLTIIDGDSKFELMQQLPDIGRVSKRPTFLLIFQDGQAIKYPVPTWINGIEAENGSGKSWIIKGQFDTSSHPYVNLRRMVPYFTNEFRGLYNTRWRKGFIRPR
jgi:hypothetical protein